MCKHFCYVLSLGMAKKDDQQTNVRLPVELKQRLKASAEKAGRSFTEELVERLEASFYSVLEATLLQARLTERGELLLAHADCEATLEDVRRELAEVESRKDPASIKRHAQLIAEEREAQRQWENIEIYLNRLTADIKLLADKLQERIWFLEAEVTKQ